MELCGWGRFPRCASELVAPLTPACAARLQAERSEVVARGNGRAYGDAAVGKGVTLSMRGLDRMIAFDAATGTVRTEAGVLLADILAAFLPRGFFPPVMPGTKFVTVGGMIAADVHGKNHHHAGGFGAHVESLTLALPSGQLARCSRETNGELLAATIGGMGLTGTIVEASFRLLPVETGWMKQRTLVAADIDGAITALETTADATYSVAWIDCLARGSSLGRSLVYLAEHATRADLLALRPEAEAYPPPRAGRLRLPVDLPGWMLNHAAMATFNDFYFRRGGAHAGAPFLTAWEPFFFPLDGIGGWNRMYGRRGFLQHQCVIPARSARAALTEIVDRISRRGDASFLAVLKQLGPGCGLLSFPLPGFTLALDFRITDGIFEFLDEIDRIVVDAGGRLYLAKDARQSPPTFEAGYEALPKFRAVRRAIGAHGRMTSHLSSRLGI
ncbi:MAG TPA: FAD-binding oxidoreductase [Methylomirabilota bacterium]|nr:FAD-binding oxidoreductase [Methylomirabilota bacterium]